MACSSAESHAHSVGGQSCWAGQPHFRMTSASICPNWEGAEEGNLSCHHYRDTTLTATTTNAFLGPPPPPPPPYLHHHHTTTPDRPSRRSGLTSMHITLP